MRANCLLVFKGGGEKVKSKENKLWEKMEESMPGLVGAAAAGLMSARFVVGKKSDVTKRRIFLGVILGIISLLFITLPILLNKLWSWHLYKSQLQALQNAGVAGQNSTLFFSLLHSLLPSHARP